jgi:hypothetical protein
VIRNRLFLGAMALVFTGALVFAQAAPASAAIEVGAEAPDFGSDGAINSEPLNLSDLKGRLILLELWKTT